MRNTLKFSMLLFAGALLCGEWGAGITFALAQEQAIKCDKVPAAVTTAFKTAYPKATIHDCSREIEKSKVAYEISSLEDKTRRDILYHEDGKIIVVEEAIPAGELPEPVQLVISKKYPKGAITLAELLTHEPGSSISYEIRLKHQGKILELVYDPDGKEIHD